MIGIPKKPADRSQRLRDLAEGEACTVMLPGGACDPATVVWAHTNTQADEKGMGYKGHDSQGFFACHRCHAAIDQPSSAFLVRGLFTDELVRQAQARTTGRLREIAGSPTMRPWKIATALWALERRAS